MTIDSILRWKCEARTGMRFTIILQQSEEGWAVSAPGLRGCHSQGVSEDEALENIRDAIREYIAAAEDITLEPGEQVVEIEL